MAVGVLQPIMYDCFLDLVVTPCVWNQFIVRSFKRGGAQDVVYFQQSSKFLETTFPASAQILGEREQIK